MTAQEMSPEIFTADYSGQPGKRAFFLQVRSTEGTFTFAIEKQQVSALAEKLSEMLLAIDTNDTVASAKPARDPVLVSIPDEPSWRIGTIGLGYEEEVDRIVVVMAPAEAGDGPGEPGEPADPLESGDSIRLVLRRELARAFVLHALAVVGEGRPLCQLCGLPMDPEGHACPASNGHHPST